jgi:signal transduction histidine kinase
MLLTRMGMSATQIMTQLISMMLDIARLEAGKMVLNIDEFDLSAMIGEAAAGQRIQVMRKAIEIVTQTTPGLMVRSDRDLLWRVVVNLLDNAIKFAPENTRIEVATRSMEGQSVHICVTDAGPGIPPGDRERIFEKFTQVNDTEHMARGGTGLGLTFCRMAVEALGGAIWVDAGPQGVGSCFHVKLPQR